MSNERPRKRSAVPSSRVGRLLRFGMLSGELALSTAVASAKQLTSGRRPDLVSAVLTPGNAERLARRLASLRGPAMKVGQMLSIQGEDVLPPEFRNALGMLRSQGYAMPDTQLRRVLGREYGKGWERKFDRFDTEPVAAASIGQLHRARKRGGRELALKIQYPGVAKSVDSDVDNLSSLLRRLEFLPVSLDVEAIAREAKRQLHLETDYESEARHLERYARHVAAMPEVSVPHVDRALTTRRILAMDWIDGEPLEGLASEAVPQSTRNAVARTLQELMFRELFEFRFMQTDPNIANYLYRPETGQLALLDLGAASEFRTEFVDHYRRICRAILARDRAGIRDAAFAIGYASPDDPPEMTEGALDIIELVCEPLAHRGPYDFAGSGLIGRARDLGLAVVFDRGLRSPPPETIFLHRKLLGTFLVCSRLRARVNVHALIERFV
jgi:predicted unusual protein kinase regulating ubiquinone biosynthesis (AarF/ABC1/UbiB family)